MITAVPQELIEHVVVAAAKDGFPQTVAALSQTCSHFYSFLGLRSDNKHIWRALFLAVFDHPRVPEGSYDWKLQFLNRMHAERLFRQSTHHQPEQEPLLHSLRTLLTAVTTENSVMYFPVGDPLGMHDATLFGSPLSDTRLAYPLVIVLHALELQRGLQRTTSAFTLNESWGLRFLEQVRSSTSAWAEDVLRNGYPLGLVDRLCTFDPWIYRRPRRNREGKQKQTSNPPSIVNDSEWELTETGRLFYKLVFMKGPLLNRTRFDVKRSHQQIRIAARKRVYDMRYPTKQRLYGPFLPVTQPLSYGVPLDGKGKEPLQSPSSPSSGSEEEEEEEEETTQIHLDMLALLSAGIHPHFLLHNHFVHPGTDPFSGDEDVTPAPHSPNQYPLPKKLNPEGISPHRIVPDYPFLSAARYLIEANMKEAWGNLINIAQDIGGVVDEDEDEDYSEEGDGEDEDEDEDEDTDEDRDDVSILPKDVSPDAGPSSIQPTDTSTEEQADEEEQDLTDHEWSVSIRNTRRWVERLIDSFSYLDFVRVGGAAGYWKEGIKERWEALRAHRGGPSADDVGVVDGWDWAGVEGEWRRIVCWMDYQDLLLHSSRTGRSTGNEEDINEAIRLLPITLRITGYSPPPLRPTTSSSTPVQDESGDPNALIWHLPVIHFSGESKLTEQGTGTQPQVRKLKGTAKMIGDGAVLWTMTSSHVGQDDPFVVNGVQIGCIGSAAGFVGMWTGAEHNRGDPIGPSWQWKVT